MSFLRTNLLFLLVFTLSLCQTNDSFASSSGKQKRHSSSGIASQGQVKKVKKILKKCSKKTHQEIKEVKDELVIIENDLVNIDNNLVNIETEYLSDV